MLSVSLKDHVQQALRQQWPAFARAHPQLAAVMDRTLLLEQATLVLADDAEFRDALERGAAAGLASQTLTDLAGRLVGRFLAALPL